MPHRPPAERLGITQPPLSRTISALERKLDVPLLVRSTRQVEPTRRARCCRNEPGSPWTRCPRCPTSLVERANCTSVTSTSRRERRSGLPRLRSSSSSVPESPINSSRTVLLIPHAPRSLLCVQSTLLAVTAQRWSSQRITPVHMASLWLPSLSAVDELGTSTRPEHGHHRHQHVHLAIRMCPAGGHQDRVGSEHASRVHHRRGRRPPHRTNGITIRATAGSRERTGASACPLSSVHVQSVTAPWLTERTFERGRDSTNL